MLSSSDDYNAPQKINASDYKCGLTVTAKGIELRTWMLPRYVNIIWDKFWTVMKEWEKWESGGNEGENEGEK